MPIFAPALAAAQVYYSRRNIRGSTWKLNLVAKQIRGLAITDAINQMEFSNKKVAKQVSQVRFSPLGKGAGGWQRRPGKGAKVMDSPHAGCAQVLRIAQQNAKVHNKIEDNENLYVIESYVGRVGRSPFHARFSAAGELVS